MTPPRRARTVVQGDGAYEALTSFLKSDRTAPGSNRAPPDVAARLGFAGVLVLTHRRQSEADCDGSRSGYGD